MKPVLFLLFMAFSLTVISQTCLPDGYHFISQQYIDNFTSNYPGCTQISGNVYFYGDDINNLDGLANLTHIGGELSIQVQNPVNLTGLNNVEFVGGDILIASSLTGLNCLNNLTSANRLLIRDNVNLSTLNSFGNLKTVTEDILVYSNPLLENISWLSNLENVSQGKRLLIENHPKLISLSGLEKLSNVEGSIIITSNPSLKDLSGLDNLTEVNELGLYSNDSLANITHLSKLKEVATLSIKENPALVNLEGLNNLVDITYECSIWQNKSLETLSSFGFLDTIEGGFHIYGNPNLKNIEGLSHLTYIKGGISISGNESLDNLKGLNNLRKVGYLGIYESPVLPNLNDLSQLDSISSGLFVRGLSLITNLSGLENLQYIGGILGIQDNESLTSLSALSNLKHASELSIINNPSLASLSGIDSVQFTDYWIRVIDNPLISACNIPSICNVMADFGGWSFYSGNAPGCNSRDEVYISCGLSDTDEENEEAVLRLYPNPATDLVTIETDVPLSKAYINDSTGRFSGMIDLSNGSRTLDLSRLAKGVYFIRFMIGEQMVVRKVMKM